MKRLIPFLWVFGLGLAVAAVFVNSRQATRHARELETQRAAWETEKAELAAALEKARARRGSFSPLPRPVAPAASVAAPDPQALLNQLAGLQVAPGSGRALRPVLALLEQLTQAGPSALPVLRQFLASGQDVAYNPPGGKGPRDLKSLADALVPPSLRFALFDVVRQIGGDDAETLLAETLGRAGRGLEVAYLTQVLEEMAPGRYKDAALAAARNLLASGTGSDRDFLFDVLRRFSDTSYVATAQGQLVQPNGLVDRSALRYLQQTLGEQSVALAAQLYQDGRLIEPGSKEPLARLALTFVGANQQAGELFHTAVLDQALLPDQKRELVEDLNQDGLSSQKAPTPEDLKIIAGRYALTQAYLQQDYVQSDQVLNEAFREADKDLRNMLQKAAAAAAKPAPAPPDR
ncbi:MAG: hypothetical protein HY674_04525 [Chloroflexi bacterium]|nr:hypothetical protein [Chloroflexota bacterium]